MFNPYSGVKTSILILDKVLAPKTDSIAFFKVENDGYDLGAQRRPVDKDDLPSVQSEVSEYLGRLKRGEGVENFRSASGVVVEKGRVGEDGEYNLSGERYKEPDTVGYSFPVIRIDEVCTVNPRKSELADLRQDTKVSFVPMSDLGENQIRFRPIQEKPLSDTLNGYTYFADNDVLLARVTPCFENGKAGIAQGLLNGIGFGSSEFVVLRCGEKISPEWMYFSVTHPLFRNWAIRQMTGTGGLQRVPRSVIAEFQIPLPPLEVQRELVAEIDGYQRVIDGARQMVASYRPHIAIDPNWPTAELGTACVVNPPKKEVAELDDVTEVSFVPMADIGENLMFFQPQDSRQLGALGSSYTYFRDDDVLLARVTPCFENGKAGIARQLHSGVGFGSSEFYVLRSQGLTTPEWIYICVAAPEFKAWATPKMTGTGGLQRVPRWAVEQYKIPLPSLETQRAIVAELDEEQAAIDQAKRLAVKMEKRIQDVLARVWES